MSASALFSAETLKAHRATWWVWADGVKMRHQASMRGSWGYDVTCSCGEFETRTGGGTRNYVESELWFHRYEAEAVLLARECPRDPQIPGSVPAVPEAL